MRIAQLSRIALYYVCYKFSYFFVVENKAAGNDYIIFISLDIIKMPMADRKRYLLSDMQITVTQIDC